HPPPRPTLFPYTTLFRSRGWNSIFRRALADRLAARLHHHPADVVLVFKGTHLDPADVVTLRRQFAGRWVNWFPDDPHDHETSTRDRKSTRLNSSHLVISY